MFVRWALSAIQGPSHWLPVLMKLVLVCYFNALWACGLNEPRLFRNAISVVLTFWRKKWVPSRRALFLPKCENG